MATDNTLSMTASKSVSMTFLSLLNLGPVTVTAHAKAGFGTQYLDTVMVLDATQSMVGNPITQAKAAATTFKNILLGVEPAGQRQGRRDRLPWLLQGQLDRHTRRTRTASTRRTGCAV